MYISRTIWSMSRCTTDVPPACALFCHPWTCIARSLVEGIHHSATCTTYLRDNWQNQHLLQRLWIWTLTQERTCAMHVHIESCITSQQEQWWRTSAAKKHLTYLSPANVVHHVCKIGYILVYILVVQQCYTTRQPVKYFVVRCKQQFYMKSERKLQHITSRSTPN